MQLCIYVWLAQCFSMLYFFCWALKDDSLEELYRKYVMQRGEKVNFFNNKCFRGLSLVLIPLSLELLLKGLNFNVMQWISFVTF